MTIEIRKCAAVLGTLILAVGVIAGPAAETAGAQVNRRIDADAKRTGDATAAFSAIMALEALPRAVVDRAEGIAVFPLQPRLPRRRGQGPNTLRTARLLDIQGRGILSARAENGNWSPPAFLALAGGSIPDDADLLLVAVSRRGLENMMRFEYKIDADAAVAPGPLAGDASAWTELQQRAEIFSYARSREGLAGVSIAGSAVQTDTSANERFYGKPLTTALAIAQAAGREPTPAWRAALEKHAAR